ncbi:glutathione S-transferase N-terminal domain-containing protein [Alphaproteobacteria bacterium]|nr:glutathione S-transferase N-terminal domain-containing protein [Alphaproteobacteria bacterium]
MIDLYTWPTPNGRKISILLEELNVQYKIIPIDIGNNEQFQKEFTKISPSNKIPAIFDHETQTSIFESGAIMLYLADKYNKFLPKKSYWMTMEWFMFQLTQVGPILGQAHQFLFYHPGQGEFVEKKYIDYAKRIYQTLNDHLRNNEYLGVEYSIADIATWPWIARFERHRIMISDYVDVFRWYKLIRQRPAVIKGYNAVGGEEGIPI